MNKDKDLLQSVEAFALQIKHLRDKAYQRYSTLVQQALREQIIILEESGSNLVLIGWNDYWERFGALYPVGEKEKIEEACRRSKES